MCEPFSLSLLSQSPPPASYEDQVYVSHICINTALMAGVFITYVVLLSLMTVIVAALLLREYWTERRLRLTSRKKTYWLALIYAAGKLGLYAAFLAGVHHPWRYVFFPIGSMTMILNCLQVLRDWFVVTTTIEEFHVINAQGARGLQVSSILLGSIYIFGNVVGWFILPIVFENNPLGKNIGLITGQLLIAIGGTLFGVQMFLISKRMAMAITPVLIKSPEEASLVIIRGKLAQFRRFLTNLFGNMGMILIGLPLWYILTAKPGGFGMDYNFYVVHFMLVPTEISIVVMLIYMVQRIQTPEKGSGQKIPMGQSSEQNKRKSLSDYAKELNPDVPALV